ncbi:MAG: hypothetical protein V1717_03055 [Candidatus Micrarchaeota archaeon]
MPYEPKRRKILGIHPDLVSGLKPRERPKETERILEWIAENVKKGHRVGMEVPMTGQLGEERVTQEEAEAAEILGYDQKRVEFYNQVKKLVKKKGGKIVNIRNFPTRLMKRLEPETAEKPLEPEASRPTEPSEEELRESFLRVMEDIQAGGKSKRMLEAMEARYATHLNAAMHHYRVDIGVITAPHAHFIEQLRGPTTVDYSVSKNTLEKIKKGKPIE